MVTQQEKKWNDTYLANGAHFGESPSMFSIRSADTFKRFGLMTILELGAGQGRDTKYFIEQGLNVIAEDISEVACSQLRQRFGDRITVVKKDLKEGVGIPKNSIDGCYAHLLLTMDFSDDELRRIIKDVRDALLPGGMFIFSVRNQNDTDYESGVHEHDNVWTNPRGFSVRFYSKDEIMGFMEGFDVTSIYEFSEGGKVIYGITAKKIIHPSD